MAVRGRPPEGHVPGMPRSAPRNGRKGSRSSMPETELQKVNRLAVKAVYSDDTLMNMLVLKGGNALDLVYGPAHRMSRDLDFSVAERATTELRDRIREHVDRRLREQFWGGGYEVKEISLRPVPGPVSGFVDPRLGGYEVTVRYRKQGPGDESTGLLQIEISCREYCEPKQQVDFEGLRIYAYTPAMIVIEKLRALCQQTREYCRSTGLHNSPRGRARDFFDIRVTVKKFGLELTSADNLRILKSVFAAKGVPYGFLSKIPEYRELHRQDFASVEGTVRADVELETFDFYFKYVVELAHSLLEALGVVEPPAF